MIRTHFVLALGGVLAAACLSQAASAAGVVWCDWGRAMEIVIRQNNYSQDEQRGTVQDVTFADVAVTSPHPPPSSFRGFDAEHGVDGVTIANLRLNGQPVRSAAEARLQIGPHVRGVQVTDSAAPAIEPTGRGANP